MRERGWSWLGVLVAVVGWWCVPTAEGQESGGALLVCYPNAPGDPESAGGVMETWGEYLSARAGRCAPVYFNEEEPARAWLEGSRPRLGVVSLPLFLRWREEFELRVVARTEVGGALEERLHLLVGADAEWEGLEEFVAGGRRVVWSSHLDDVDFAERVVFGGRVEVGEQLEVASTDAPLRALRRLKRGDAFQGRAVDAVLVDDETYRALQELSSYRDAVRVLYQSPPMPTPVVVAFGGADEGALVEALVGMGEDASGRELLETLRTGGFHRAGDEDLEAVIRAYGEAR